MEREQSKLVKNIQFAPYQHIFESLVGQYITRVSLEPWSVRLLFETAELHIEGSWKLWDADHALIDHNQELGQRIHFDLWRITGKHIIGFLFVSEPILKLTIQLADGWAVEVEADDDGYDDWSLIDSRGAFWLVCNGTL